MLSYLYIYTQYIMISSYILFSLIMGFLMILLALVLAMRNPDNEKLSSYECGFEPFEDARNKFDVRFYIVAILFIIFDVEVLYLFPWISVVTYIGTVGIWAMLWFLIILALGFVYELSKKALEWQ